MNTCARLLSNTRLHVVERGSGQPLLLVHGFPLDHQMWQGQFAELSQEFRVIAPDLRGFGQSDDATDTVTMQQYADDLAELLDALGIDQPVAFCGLSMGGYIAWQFWRRHATASVPFDSVRYAVRTGLSRGGSDATANGRARAGGRDRRADRHDDSEAVLRTHAAAELDRVVTATEQVIRAARPAGVAAALRGMAQRVDATPWLPGDPRAHAGGVWAGGCDRQLWRKWSVSPRAIPQAEFVVIPLRTHGPAGRPVHVNKAIRGFSTRDMCRIASYAATQTATGS